MDEIWKDVRGYESKYAVSNMGRVKSLNYGRTGKEKILRPCKTRLGYLSVRFYKNRKFKTYKVHRLVLSTFNPIENMENLEVNHLDENKENNRLQNLEWCDRSYNVNHGTRNARVAEKNSLPIVQLSLDGKYIRSYKSSHDAAREGGYNPGNINSCCKGKRKTHGGFRWMYLKDWLKEHNKGIPKKLYFIE